MMTKEQKKVYIDEMSKQFENSKAVMVTHYQGLTMPQIDELRSKMREHGIIFKITEYFLILPDINGLLVTTSNGHPTNFMFHFLHQMIS